MPSSEAEISLSATLHALEQRLDGFNSQGRQDKPAAKRK
jgi:hypothetical protein